MEFDDISEEESTENIQNEIFVDVTESESFYFAIKFVHTTRLLKLKRKEFSNFDAFILKGNSFKVFFLFYILNNECIFLSSRTAFVQFLFSRKPRILARKPT